MVNFLLCQMRKGKGRGGERGTPNRAGEVYPRILTRRGWILTEFCTFHLYCCGLSE